MPRVFAANYWSREDCCQVGGGWKQFGSFFMFLWGRNRFTNRKPRSKWSWISASQGKFRLFPTKIGKHRIQFFGRNKSSETNPPQIRFWNPSPGTFEEIFEKNPLKPLQTHQLERWNPPQPRVRATCTTFEDSDATEDQGSQGDVQVTWGQDFVPGDYCW